MAGAQLAPLTYEDREQLKRALLETDDETRRCVGPLLALEPVQYALLSFVNDPSRSFEDHVWDPVTQTVLNRLRSTGIGPSDSQVQMNSVFETELMQCARDGGAVVEITNTEKEAELLAEVDKTQADGKTKFERGDHYAAMNAFKKSVLGLLAYHEDQNYGNVYDPHEWDEEDLRQRYVTLCCNVAVCAIKLRDCAMIRLYAAKALRVDEYSSKAIYALAKVNLLEHRFEDARAEAQKGLGLYPGNGQLAKLLRDIDAVELRQVEDRVNLLVVKELMEKVEDEAQKRRDQQEAAQRARLERAAEVTPLPMVLFDKAPFQQLNIYFMRIKQSLQVTIDPVFNPDNGESSLFECTVVNGSTNDVLAAGVRAASKKLAKHTAAKAAILKLWEMKREAGKLLPEDQERWDQYETALRDGTIPPHSSPPTSINDENAVMAPQSNHTDNQVIQLAFFERDSEPAAVLNMLSTQRRLCTEFTMDDVSPSKLEPLFKCTCVINGQELGVATAPAKKKAKAEAARLAMNAAVASGIIQFIRTVTAEVPSVPMSENGAVAEGLEVA